MESGITRLLSHQGREYAWPSPVAGIACLSAVSARVFVADDDPAYSGSGKRSTKEFKAAGCDRFLYAEFRAVGQHAVQHDGKPAGERHLGLAHCTDRIEW
jgi:hypothetical protein